MSLSLGSLTLHTSNRPPRNTALNMWSSSIPALAMRCTPCGYENCTVGGNRQCVGRLRLRPHLSHDHSHPVSMPCSDAIQLATCVRGDLAAAHEDAARMPPVVHCLPIVDPPNVVFPSFHGVPVSAHAALSAPQHEGVYCGRPRSPAPHRRTYYKRPRAGICSSYLASLAPGAAVYLSIRPGLFRLPQSAAHPLVMVGPGTGVAPMRGIILERQHGRAQSPPGESEVADVMPDTLFFGCR